MLKKDLLKDLNEKQREAVTAPMGPVLVLAGAGSGKTRALTYRIAYLIAEKLVKPENILAVTFTNKAAGEMKERVERLLADGLGGQYGGRSKDDGNQRPNPETKPAATPTYLQPVTMGTFHSICVRILRAEIERLGIGYDRNFTIYDAEDTKGLLKQIVIELDLDREYKPQMFGYYISRAKNLLVEPNKLEIGKDYLQRLIQQVYEIYQERLMANNALDFDDLLAMTVRLLRKDRAVLKKYQERFKYILVDEYQDTNHAQYLFLKMLSKKHRNIFVVGDDAQSIYGFRGANMQNILNFAKDYKKAKTVMLEQNYRSTQNILSAANQVIRLNKFQYEKDLWTENYPGAQVSLYEALDEIDESEHVVNRIMNNDSRIKNLEFRIKNDDEPRYEDDDDGILSKYMRKQNRRTFQYPISNIQYQIPKDLNNSVILYRTHAQSRAFEEAMMSAGIPYQIVGGIRFYERREIKDALAYLRLIANPRDLVSLSRVINVPARGIGAQSFKVVKAALKKYKFNYKRILNNIDELELSAKALAGAREFFSVYNANLLTENANDANSSQSSHISSPGSHSNILDIMDTILTRSGYKDMLLDGTEEGAARWENIEELVNVAAKFKKLPWQEGVREFLAEVALMTDLDKKDDSENRLTLMTLHSAKGLEFDRVFFVGLEEGLLPHSRSIMSSEEIAEEIRLAYVGMTRARRELFLSYAKSRNVYGELKRSVPSRILKAIPKSLLRKLN